MEQISVEIKNLLEENAELRCRLFESMERNDALFKTLQHFNRNAVRQEMHRNGLSPSKKEDITIYDVLRLHNQGYNKMEIAAILEVSLSTVYRRFEKLQKTGLLA